MDTTPLQDAYRVFLDAAAAAALAPTPAMDDELPSEPLARACVMLRRHEDEVVHREVTGRPFDDADRAVFLRELLSAYLGRDVREVLAATS